MSRLRERTKRGREIDRGGQEICVEGCGKLLSTYLFTVSSYTGAVESDYTLDPSEIEVDSDHAAESSTTATTAAPASPAKSQNASATNSPAHTAKNTTSASLSSPAHQPPVDTPAEMKIGGITFVQCATGGTGSKPPSTANSPAGSPPREVVSGEKRFWRYVSGFFNLLQ